MIEEESRGVVVEAEKKHVGLLFGEPSCDRLVALEERLPVGIVLLALVERDADGRHVRGADPANDPCHARILRYAIRMAKECSHRGLLANTPTPSGKGCAECLKLGQKWVELRMCQTCGHVGC